MPAVYACICPGSLVPTEAPGTAAALDRVREELGGCAPETVVLVLVRERGAPGVVTAESVRRDAGSLQADPELAERTMAEAAHAGLRAETVRHWDGDGGSPAFPWLDDTLAGARLMAVAASRSSRRQSFDFGRALGRALEAHDRRVALVCGVGLARARDHASRGADERAARMFDDHYQRALERWDVKWMVQGDDELRHRVAEDAVAQTAVLMGALSGYRITPRVLSHETPDGAGCLVAAIDVLGLRRKQRAE